MRVTKWTIDFDPSADAPIVPIWIALPGLPIHYQQKAALFEIARIVGHPIKLDVATADGLRPSVARICVEADISKELPKKIFLEGKQKIHQQQIIYEDLPSFCMECRRLGHATSNCGQNASDMPPPPPTQQKPKQRWTPKKGSKDSTLDPVPVTLLRKPTKQYTAAESLEVETLPSQQKAGTNPSLNPDHIEEGFHIHRLFEEPHHSARVTLEEPDVYQVSDSNADQIPQTVHTDDASRAQFLQQMRESLDTIKNRLSTRRQLSSSDDAPPHATEDTTHDGFMPVAPRRRRRRKHELPPRPPSTVTTRSASRMGAPTLLLP